MLDFTNAMLLNIIGHKLISKQVKFINYKYKVAKNIHVVLGVNYAYRFEL